MLIPLILMSCKASKPTCDAYSEMVIPVKDTIIFEYQHIHYEGKNICHEFPADTLILIDTIVIKYKNI